MVRSFVAIVAGFVLTGALNVGTNLLLSRAELIPPPGTPVTNPSALVLVCAYVAVFGILGCYVTGRLAPSRPMLHALVMGALALAMSIPMAIGAWNDAPAWFNVYNLLAVMPYAWIGGKLAERGAAARPRVAAAS